MGQHFEFGDEARHWRACALSRREQRERFRRLLRLGTALRQCGRHSTTPAATARRHGPTCRD